MSGLSKSGLLKAESLALVALSLSLALLPGRASAQSSSHLPPPPLPSASGQPVGNASAALVPIGGVSGGGPAPGSASSASSHSSASFSSPSGASSMPGPGPGMPGPADIAPPASMINTADLVVVPGPGEDKRKALLGRIMEAKSRGIGTSTYMMAFDALEQSVKSGVANEAVFKRVDSLNSSLDDQFKRSAILKTQRAAPPVAASDPTTPLGAAGLSAGSAGNTDTAALIQKLQAKYGNQIPDNLKDKIPAGMGNNPAELLKNPQLQDLLKGMKNK
ncbi:MAG: hypothetical protein KGS72_17040 [Cyanobacteria bacterium REEB67]|nr:hypothetical protein [Cyanobacteria bacterium REEB67]